MNNIELKKTAKKLVSAFNKGTFIAPLSTKFTKNSKIANELRKESEKLITLLLLALKLEERVRLL
jgi:hypothetical protein